MEADNPTRLTIRDEEHIRRIAEWLLFSEYGINHDPVVTMAYVGALVQHTVRADKLTCETDEIRDTLTKRRFGVYAETAGANLDRAIKATWDQPVPATTPGE